MPQENPGPPAETPEPLLRVRDLTVAFTQRHRRDQVAVDHLDLDIPQGSTVGLVGESGSGKSVTSLAVLGLLPRRGVRLTGSIRFGGRELLGLSPADLRTIRGKDIAMVFQDPMTCLNPVLTIGTQVTEVLHRHQKLPRGSARERAADLLDQVGIPDPARRLGEYPHQLSGGMRQRALIAIALACRPRLLIADEPTTALDVTIQAQILALLRDLVTDTGTTLLLITHDLGIVAGTCDTVHVMYSGRIVESAPRGPLFADPAHPYTAGLLSSVPRLDAPRGTRLVPVPGSPTDTLPWDNACAFAPRCTRADALCTDRAPHERTEGPRTLRCHHPLSDPAPDPAPDRAPVLAPGPVPPTATGGPNLLPEDVA
ncbi:MAG: peptide/nickel transport system ATP-binding protein [Actinomycetota bacterium]|nr:peptide/nickel transport system ATP-binding protein [Actinomycetota bacterium]